MNNNNIPVIFPITLFSDTFEKVNDTISKGRVRIFYRGGNRNGSYISDEFAEELIKTLPYAPVKGIYDDEATDYTDHGQQRTQGRIYGIVPDEEKWHFAWERHLDDDGIEREYACCDVYLYTALYSEASEILGKGQSMELYPPSIKGQWIKEGGKSYFKYSHGSFLGLQVLGDKATPCFEGSSFFSLNEQQVFELLTAFFQKLEELPMGESDKMENETVYTFTLSDNQKQSAIMKELNKESFRYAVLDSYDNYALVYDFEKEEVQKIEYSKNEDDSIVLGTEFVTMYCEYVTKEEKESIDALRANTESQTFAQMNEKFEQIKNDNVELANAITAKVSELNTLTAEHNDLTIERDSANSTINSLNEQIATMTTELDSLRSFKHSAELNVKNDILNKFSVKLNADAIEKYRNKIEEYTAIDLEKELSYELVKNTANLFTADDAQIGYIAQEEPLNGLAALLNKYKN